MRVRTIVVAIGCLGSIGAAFGQEPIPENASDAVQPRPIGAEEMLTAPIVNGYQGEVIGDVEPAPEDLPPTPDSWEKSAFLPVPTLEARIEAVWLQPSFSESVPLFLQFAPTDEGLFAPQPLAADINTQFVAAARVEANFRMTPNKSLDSSAFYLGGPDHQGIVGQRDGLKFISTTSGGFIANLPPEFPTNVDLIALDWDFESWGIDTALMHHWIPLHGPIVDFSIGLGARYFFIDERTTLFLDNERSLMTGVLAVKTENLLLGPQLASKVIVQTHWSRMRLLADAKVGFMVNSPETKTAVAVETPTEASRLAGTSYNRTQFSPLVESNFFVEFAVNTHVAIFGGYQLLYVGQVDRASQQYTTDIDTFVIDHKELSTLFMHGPRAGILFTY